MTDSGFSHSTPCAASATPTPAVDAIERWQLAGMQVRLCVYPDEPRLIERFLAMGRGLPAQSPLSCRDIALRSAHLLLDSAADRGLPMHWRCLCLDNVHRPLSDLAESIDGDFHRRQLFMLNRRLATLDISVESSAYPGDE